LGSGHEPTTHPPLSPPWTVEQIPGGFKVLDANGQSLAYVYGREKKADADTHVLTMDEAKRIASNIAKLPQLLNEAAIKLSSRGQSIGILRPFTPSSMGFCGLRARQKLS
jgi:hypothetical protein